jgi:hypothetical protein
MSFKRPDGLREPTSLLNARRLARRDDALLLQEISTLLIQEGDIDALYERILDGAISLMASDMGSMQIFDPRRNELRLLAWRGFHPASGRGSGVVATGQYGQAGEECSKDRDVVQQRLDANPQAMRQGRETVEHPFGTMKARMGATHFLTKGLPKVAAEMALSVLAYNLRRVMNIVGIKPLLAAIAA